MPDPTTKQGLVEKNGSLTTPQINVFAVHGVEPEVQAYAMAKYSRSALSMKESLKEISEQKAEQFLNTFYFQYGHRSIADLAHIALAIEKLSILAAIILVDEQRWDGQERSTRYQNFKKSGYYVPDFDGDESLRSGYCATVDFLFSEYEVLSQEMLQYYKGIVVRPPEMPDEAYTRTLRARAFDISRYLLPLGTNTSLGEIVNARTLEMQIARLLSSPFPEVVRLGELLKQAARQPAFNVQSQAVQELVEDIGSLDRQLGNKAHQLLLRPVSVAPTLVKYAEANAYTIKTREALAQAAKEIMGSAPIEAAPLVDLMDDEPIEVEIASTLLYSACHYSYRQVTQRVQSMSAAQRQEVIDLGLRHRGPHDEPLRSYHAGQQFKFDILMDVGGFRDMHRHRRCTQIEQGFTSLHGYDTPPEIVTAGLESRYQQAMKRVLAMHDQLASTPAPSVGLYVLPLAFRKRTLFKMDLAEALYIAELRTAPAGHISYRKVAYAMYQAVAQRHPSLAKHFRVTDPKEAVDLLQR
ncbi:MAG TPA: FAD-dependent thymidylate synthase [Candidatus Angelobacter sp.]|jgi:thymidylate synthase ThyX|nr:FAD-dependent thymidylate synthase [Candidatus Angelobacter sp.]